MKIDKDRIDDAVLALLQLTLHDRNLAWKGLDWDVLDRLHAKGLISDPRTKTKSVGLTEEGRQQSENLFQNMFMIEDDSQS